MATTFYAFRRTVTTSGTPVQLDTYAVESDQEVLIKAQDSNAGIISIGNSAAEADKDGAENFLLSAGQSVTLKVPNTNEIWIDSTESGDIVEVLVGGGSASSSDGSSGESQPVTLEEALTAISAGQENDNILTAPMRRSDAFQATITSADASAATAVKAKTADKRIYITDLIISVGAAINVQLQDDAGSPLVVMEQIYMAANTTFEKHFSTPLQVPLNQDLDVIASGAGNISVTVSGYVI